MHMKTKTLFLIGAMALLGSVAAEAGDIVVIVNPAATAPSKAEVADIYLGKSQSFTPVDLPDSSPIYAEFYQKATGRDASQIKAVWSRLVFTGKTQAPKSLPDAAAVKKAVAGDPKAIGYIEKSAVDGTVKVATAID
jgi:ABC-type phosphate transport system substrate-binding protein